MNLNVSFAIDRSCPFCGTMKCIQQHCDCEDEETIKITKKFACINCHKKFKIEINIDSLQIKVNKIFEERMR